MDNTRQGLDPVLDFVRRNRVATALMVLVVVSMAIATRQQNFAAAWIYGLTALAVIWYTMETARIRAQADDDARRARTPILKFVVNFPKGDSEDLTAIVRVRNYSGRLAIIRVTVRREPSRWSGPVHRGRVLG